MILSVMPKTINFNNQAGDIEINLEELKNKLKFKIKINMILPQIFSKNLIIVAI